MNDYEVWAIDKHVAGPIAILKEKFCTDSAEQAMKCFVRDNLTCTFYYESWQKSYNVYTKGIEPSLLYVVFNTHSHRSSKEQMVNVIYDKFIRPKSPNACDCGSEKVYGKSGAHSHWCSTRG